jgi:hypothetical protein
VTFRDLRREDCRGLSATGISSSRRLTKTHNLFRIQSFFCLKNPTRDPNQSSIRIDRLEFENMRKDLL